MYLSSGLYLTHSLAAEGALKDHCGVFQHWEVFKEISEVFILVPALVGLKGNLEMTLASRLSTAVSGKTLSHTQRTRTHTIKLLLNVGRLALPTQLTPTSKTS